MRKGWKEVLLGEACHLHRKRTDPRLMPPEQVLTHWSIPALDETRGPLREPASAIGSHKFIVTDDSVIVSLLNPRIPRSAVVSGGHWVVCSTEFAVLTRMVDRMDLQFLAVLVSAAEFQSALAGLVSGTTKSRERAGADDLMSLPILLPPLVEQRRIVDLVAAVDSAIEAAEREADAGECAYGVILNDAVSGALPTDRLSDVVEWARAGGTPSRKRTDYFGGQIPWLKSGEVDDRTLLETEEAITESALAESSAWIVPKGSVLLAMYGATAGKVGYTNFPLATNQAVLAITGKDGMLHNRWLYHWLRSRSDDLKRQATGAAQPNLSKDRVLSQEMPRVGFDKQQELSELLDGMIGLVDSTRTWATRALQLRSALLADLLSGDHEIPETYDELLTA